MYALAVFLFYLFHLNSAWITLHSLYFGSVLYGPSPQTLWFVTVLFIYYLATPGLLKLVKHQTQYLVINAMIYLVLCIAYILFKTLDHRLVMYFPCYVAGIYCAQYGFKNKITNHYTALACLCLGAGLTVFKINSYTLDQMEFQKHPIVLSTSYLILAFCITHEKHFKKTKWIAWLSYISFCMYLFHRIIFHLVMTIYFPSTATMQPIYLLICGVPGVAGCAWLIQKSYDKLLTRILR